MTTLPPEQLALEIEDLIRTMPGPRDFLVNPDKCLPWLGRASAAMRAWDAAQSLVHFEPLVRSVSSGGNFDFSAVRRTSSCNYIRHKATCGFAQLDRCQSE